MIGDQHFYESVVASLPAGICTVDREGCIVHLNPALERMLGCRLLEKRGQPLARCLEKAIVDPAQIVCWTVGLSEALAHGRTTYLNLPVQFRSEAGEPQSLIGVMVPWRDGTGRRLGALAIFHRSELHNDLDDVRTRFLSVVSHEFGSPVTNLTAAADLLADLLDGSSEEQWRLLRVIRAEAARLRRLLAQFLSRAPLQGEGSAPEREMITLAPILRRVARSFQVQDTGRELVVQTPGNLPFVWGDEDRIEEVLANLVGNAMRYSPAGTPIVLAARAWEDDVEVSVTDLGAGIEQEDAESIFEGRPRSSAQAQGGTGSGLGLQIARTLVQALGGKLWYRSGPGGGASLCFSLQRVPDMETERA